MVLHSWQVLNINYLIKTRKSKIPPPPLEFDQYLKAEWIEKSHFSMVAQTVFSESQRASWSQIIPPISWVGVSSPFSFTLDEVKFNVILWVTLKDLL